MNQGDSFVVIRVYQPGDEAECSKLLKEGAMATVKASFFTALTREITFQIIITMAAVMFVFIGLSPTICLAAIPCTIVFIFIYVYVSHLNTATILANQAYNIDKEFLSSKYSCFWIAEAYEVPSFKKNWNQKKLPIISEDELDKRLQDDKIFVTNVIGIVGVNRCNIVYESARLKRLTVHFRYQRKGVGTALLNKVIDFCQNKGYNSIELVTSEYHDAARKLFLQKGFKLRQLYHKSFSGILVQMYQFTLPITPKNSGKKME